MEVTAVPNAQDGDNSVRETPDLITENWSDDAPRGGRAVMNRMIKENATVPLFFAQTLIQSLRDVGYPCLQFARSSNGVDVEGRRGEFVQPSPAGTGHNRRPLIRPRSR
jgi:hypothetical protein